MDATQQPIVSNASAVRRVRRLLDDAGASLVGRRVLAMCSGGADSVALVSLVARLPRGAAPASIEVLWLDHSLRKDVDAECATATAAAQRIGAPLHRRRAPDDLLRASEGGLEAAARSWRYATAIDVAAELGSDVVVTGHTASDQLESALLALVGVTGRSGDVDAMPVARELASGVQLVRPLLALTRAEVEATCRDEALAWADDPTNADPDVHARNTIRHRVVPVLAELHPGAGAALVRAGARSSERSRASEALADALLLAWSASAPLAPTIDVRRLSALPASARTELVAAWLRRNGVGRALTARTIVAVERLATKPARAGSCTRIDLAGGACVRRDGYHLRIQHAPAHGGSRP